MESGSSATSCGGGVKPPSNTALRVMTKIWIKQQRCAVRHVPVFQSQPYRTQIYRYNILYLTKSNHSFYNIGSHTYWTILDDLAVALATANSDETTASQSTSMQITLSCSSYYAILQTYVTCFTFTALSDYHKLPLDCFTAHCTVCSKNAPSLSNAVLPGGPKNGTVFLVRLNVIKY